MDSLVKTTPSLISLPEEKEEFEIPLSNSDSFGVVSSYSKRLVYFSL
jgi:hypothetical protein